MRATLFLCPPFIRSIPFSQVETHILLVPFLFHHHFFFDDVLNCCHLAGVVITRRHDDCAPALMGNYTS